MTNVQGPKTLSNRGFLSIVLLILPFVLSACSSIKRATETILPKASPSILYSAVVADEATAVLAARDVLARGGNAADAAVSLYFTLATTFPSQAGLGGSGACMVYDPNVKMAKMLDFSHTSTSSIGNDLATPMAVRGMAWLHARFGRLSWGSLLAKVAESARLGITTSSGFIKDLKSEVPRLVDDATALSLFFDRLGSPYEDGVIFQQIELGSVLGNIGARGGGVFYRGSLAKRIAVSAQAKGQRLDQTALSTVKPKWLVARKISTNGKLIFLSPKKTSSHFAKFWQRFNKKSILNFQKIPSDALDLARKLRSAATQKEILPNLGSGFTVVDGNGLAVVCSVTTGQKFGTGKFLPGLGFALSPAHGQESHALLIATDSRKNKFLFGASGYSSFSGAAALMGVAARVLIAAEPLEQALDKPRAYVAPDGSISVEDRIAKKHKNFINNTNANISSLKSIGRINALYCKSGLPPMSRGDPACTVKADKRGYGVGTKFKKEIGSWR